MAIESLYRGLFSSKSDCWSYGILLWEIFTLGNKPYPGNFVNIKKHSNSIINGTICFALGMQAGEEFCRRLCDGYRMEKPSYAPSSVYQIMLDCWKEESTERPKFSSIAGLILELMPELEQIRLGDLNDVYTSLNEVDNTTDYLMRMGEPTMHAVTFAPNESRVGPSAIVNQVEVSQYGPEPTCIISVNPSKAGTESGFATFRPGLPN